MLKISEMTYEDLEKIQDILSTNFDNFWNANILKDEIGNTNSKVFIAKRNNEIVGFIALWFGYEEIHITDIVTRKDMRNQGVATLLMEKIIKFAKELENFPILTLEVRESNIPAIKLYEKFNFKNVGKRKKYYNNKEDGIIMTLQLI